MIVLWTFTLRRDLLKLAGSNLISEFFIHGDRDFVGNSDEEIDEDALFGLRSLLQNSHQVARQTETTELRRYRQRRHVTMPWQT